MDFMGFVGTASGSNKTTLAYARVAFPCHVYP
jgi:DNA helicase IV